MADSARDTARIYLEGVGYEALVVELRGTESLSELFDFYVSFEGRDHDLDLSTLLYTGAVVSLRPEEVEPQFFYGYIEAIEYLGVRYDRPIYRARLRPAIQGLGHRVRSRIFQDQDVPEIVAQVLKEAGISDDDVVWSLQHDYEKRPYCTQYRESELDFVRRLLEEEGIFFWFEHSEVGHSLHFGDDARVHPTLSAPLPYRKDERPGPQVKHLELATRIVTDAYLARDWNWEKPDQPRHAEAPGPDGVALQRMDYPGNFMTNARGAKRANVRAAAQVVRRHELTGESNVPLRPGQQMTLIDALPASLDRGYLVLDCHHHYQSYGSGQRWGHLTRFAATYDDVEFRPERRTPRPRVPGRETAVVTGPPGEEIHCDEFGRVKLRFYWDREGPLDDKSSVFVRVQQSNLMGSLIIPRVGWEVEVGFEAGDPDRPVVLSRHYNREVMPPYELPDDLPRTSLQSSSSPGGKGVNELRFDDRNGAMEWYLHAQRNLEVRVGHAHTEEVKADRHEQVGADRRYQVGKDEDYRVAVAQSINVAENADYIVKKDHTVTVAAMDSWKVGGDYDRRADGGMTETIGAAHVVMAKGVGEAIHGNCLRTVGAAIIAIGAGGSVSVSGGSSSSAVSGSTVEVTEGTKSTVAGGTIIVTSGKAEERSGKSKAVISGADLSTQTGGAMVTKVGGDYALSAKRVVLTGSEGVSLSAGSALDLSGDALMIDAAGFAAGGAAVSIKGAVNYGGQGLGAGEREGSGVRPVPKPGADSPPDDSTQALPPDPSEDTTDSGGAADLLSALDDDTTQALPPPTPSLKSASTVPPELKAIPQREHPLREFDPEVRQIAELSPKLTKQLEALDQAGVRIVKGDASYYDSQAKLISVNGDALPATQVSSLAHEAGHALYEEPPYPAVAGKTEAEFVAEATRQDMVNEAHAQFNQCWVRAEVVNAGGPETGVSGLNAEEYWAAYDAHATGQISREDAIERMADAFEQGEVTGIDGQPYSEYYGVHHRAYYHRAGGGG
ncbi:MAG: type VI secretion system tip protein TssI/VgrG [Myxococcota bacterium]